MGVHLGCGAFVLESDCSAALVPFFQGPLPLGLLKEVLLSLPVFLGEAG